ncbi:helix-turn-helix domain-containing protein [Pseudonocardia sp. NPDC046786]|uniref:ArsR/SmtB family transcription factor n=1 Tax=Pseudonocardia sp. NPDC046786 TaxID=3155471 RepID=UPI0033F2BC61
MTADRLADLERRVEQLEQRLAAAPAVADPAVAPAATGTGTVRYSGEVALHGEVRWTIEYDAGAALALDDEPRTAVLAALGHPVRVRIVRGLLHGPRGTAGLTEVAELASTGQLYHHLRALTHAGVVEQDGRGSYRIAPRAVVPVLVLLTAAADLGGQLGS